YMSMQPEPKLVRAADTHIENSAPEYVVYKSRMRAEHSEVTSRAGAAGSASVGGSSGVGSSAGVEALSDADSDGVFGWPSCGELQPANNVMEVAKAKDVKNLLFKIFP